MTLSPCLSSPDDAARRRRVAAVRGCAPPLWNQYYPIDPAVVPCGISADGASAAVAGEVYATPWPACMASNLLVLKTQLCLLLGQFRIADEDVSDMIGVAPYKVSGVRDKGNVFGTW